MFGIFLNKNEKAAADIIGAEIHRQIGAALEKSELDNNNHVVGGNINSPFVLGYLHTFIWLGFTNQDYWGERLIEKYFNYICEGVMPKKLMEIIDKEQAKMELAKKMGKEKERVEEYEAGAECGTYDAGYFKNQPSNNANNLYRYLIDEEVVYE